MNKSSSVISILDKAIIVFTFIFLVSLTNSIFLNQLGYYGALLLLLVRYVVVKENPFYKTGLEAAFLLFIAAELLSALFSEYQSRSFFYMLRRVLLIPVVYMITASARDYKLGIRYFYAYIGMALVSVLIYLYFSYRHILLNLHNIQQSGPSVFQYPITASEIMSFTVIFLFAFLTNEKTKLRYRLLYLAGFLLSAAALFATYKRTGWIGTAGGILVILIMRKQWKLLAAGAAAVLIVLLMQQNISRVHIYDISGGTLKQQTEFDTDGRAYNVLAGDSLYYLSDYENGLTVYQAHKPLHNLQLPSPVEKLTEWTDGYFTASLVDKRFVLLKKEDNRFINKEEFITPGFSTAVKSSNGKLYIIDSDSGLTVFTNPKDLSERSTFALGRFTNVFPDSGTLLLTSYDSLTVYTLNNGMPAEPIYTAPITGRNVVFFDNGKGLISGPAGTSVISVNGYGVKISSPETVLSNIYLASNDGSSLLLASLTGSLSLISGSLDSGINVQQQWTIPFTPSGISHSGSTIYISRVKESRILSIFDPYNPSNLVRIALWRAGWEMFKDHPLFGVGDIDLQEYYLQYKRPYDKEIQGHLHNNYIHVLATLGIVGFFAVCFLLYKMLIINIRIFRNFKNYPFLSSYSLGVTGAFCAFLIAGLTEVNIWDHEILTLVLFTAGLNIALAKNINQNTK